MTTTQFEKTEGRKKSSRWRLSLRSLLTWTAWLALLVAYFARFDFDLSISHDRGSYYRTVPASPWNVEWDFRFAVWPYFKPDGLPQRIIILEQGNMAPEPVEGI